MKENRQGMKEKHNDQRNGSQTQSVYKTPKVNIRIFIMIRYSVIHSGRRYDALYTHEATSILVLYFQSPVEVNIFMCACIHVQICLSIV